MALKRFDALGDTLVVDSDTHYSEPADLWVSRAPARFRDRMPQVRRRDDGSDFWYVDGDQELMRGGGGCFVGADGEKVSFWDVDIMAGGGPEECHPGAWDVDARLAVMDDAGIWAQIVYPNVLGFAAGRLLRLDDRDLARAIVMTYNDAMAEWQEASGNRLFPQAMIPFWDIDAAVEETVRAKTELHLTGITMTGEPFRGGLPDLQEQHWDPLYEACTELSLPINIHIGAGSHGTSIEDITARVWPSQDQYRRYVLGCVQLELANSHFLSNLVTSDVLVRWPDTKWVSVESGIGWIPFVLERTEYQLLETLPADLSLVRPSPLELFRRNVYACFWFEKSGPRTLLDTLGVDNVMFETDFPHPTCLYPDPVERALASLEGMSSEVIKKVMGENATKLYSLPVPAGASMTPSAAS